jgi:hypothetical protein
VGPQAGYADDDEVDSNNVIQDSRNDENEIPAIKATSGCSNLAFRVNVIELPNSCLLRCWRGMAAGGRSGSLSWPMVAGAVGVVRLRRDCRRARGGQERCAPRRDALRASLTAAARAGFGARRSGRRDGRLDRTTGWLSTGARYRLSDRVADQKSIASSLTMTALLLKQGLQL